MLPLALVAALAAAPPDPAPRDVLEPNLLLIVYDPIMENQGGKRLHEVHKWGDPVELTKHCIADFEKSSHGRLKYRLLEPRILDAQPRFEDGFTHTDESFEAAWQARDFHKGVKFDYRWLIADQKLQAEVENGRVDEVWVYAPPIGGMFESIMAGQGAYWINGDHLPDAGGKRAFVIMGLNYERGVGEAIHSWGHRAENILNHVYGNWTPDRSTTWSRFALQDRQAKGLGGVGNVHFPVNALKDYDYHNLTSVESNADAWLTYPTLNDATRPLDAREWCPDGKDPQRTYLNWWYAHMPHIDAVPPDQRLGNWWRYLVDVDQFKSAPGPIKPTDEPLKLIPFTVAPPIWPNGEFVQWGAAGFTVQGGPVGAVERTVPGDPPQVDSLAPYVFSLSKQDNRDDAARYRVYDLAKQEWVEIRP